MNHKVVFETEHTWEFDLAKDALLKAGIPYSHFHREEEPIGFSLLARMGPAPPPRVIWCLLVPELSQDDAKKVLSEISLSTIGRPSLRFLGSVPRAKSWAIVMLILIALLLLVQIIKRMVN